MFKKKFDLLFCPAHMTKGAICQSCANEMDLIKTAIQGDEAIIKVEGEAYTYQRLYNQLRLAQYSTLAIGMLPIANDKRKKWLKRMEEIEGKKKYCNFCGSATDSLGCPKCRKEIEGQHIYRLDIKKLAVLQHQIIEAAIPLWIKLIKHGLTAKMLGTLQRCAFCGGALENNLCPHCTNVASRALMPSVKIYNTDQMIHFCAMADVSPDQTDALMIKMLGKITTIEELTYKGLIKLREGAARRAQNK